MRLPCGYNACLIEIQFSNIVAMTYAMPMAMAMTLHLHVLSIIYDDDDVYDYLTGFNRI